MCRGSRGSFAGEGRSCRKLPKGSIMTLFAIEASPVCVGEEYPSSLSSSDSDFTDGGSGFMEALSAALENGDGAKPRLGDELLLKSRPT